MGWTQPSNPGMNSGLGHLDGGEGVVEAEQRLAVHSGSAPGLVSTGARSSPTVGRCLGRLRRLSQTSRTTTWMMPATGIARSAPKNTTTTMPTGTECTNPAIAATTAPRVGRCLGRPRRLSQTRLLSI